MRGLLAVIALALAFVAGAGWHEWQAKEALKARPCTVTVWNPNLRAFMHTLLPDRECLKTGPEQVVAGTWTDVTFAPLFELDQPSKLPTDIDLSLTAPQRAKIFALAGLSYPPLDQPTRRRFHVVIIGRLGTRDCCWTDTARHTIVVQEVRSAQLLASK